MLFLQTEWRRLSASTELIPVCKFGPFGQDNQANPANWSSKCCMSAWRKSPRGDESHERIMHWVGSSATDT